MKYLVPVIVLALVGCTSPASKDAVVATVGGEIITAEEFRLNFEFGHGHLRGGTNPPEAYLRFMILEAVLAQEAQRMHLDTTAAVVHAMHTLREELLIERVFEEHVLSNIQVSEEEIVNEVNVDAVRFQFRFLPARTQEEAIRLKEIVDTNGFDLALDIIESQFDELGLEPQNLESPPLAAEDIEPDVLAVLRDLQLDEISDPVEYRGGWYLFEVTSIQRQPLSAEDYASKATSYHKVVYNRKAMEQGTKFVSDLMSPMDVTTSREGFSILSRVLWDWYEQETPVRNLLHYVDTGRLERDLARRLVAAYDVPLVSFGREQWTIRSFLEHFTPGRYVLRARDRTAFEQRLSDIIALVVRDYILLSMAEDEQLFRSETFQRTLALWKQKWMFQELRGIVVDSGSVTSRDVGAYYAQNNRLRGGGLRPYETLDSLDRSRILQQMLRDRLLNFADSLADRSHIEINKAVLDTMTFSQSMANPQMTVHLLKSNSNKMPFPIVDPNWRTASRQ